MKNTHSPTLRPAPRAPLSSLACCLLALALAGCSSWTLTPPALTLANLEVVEITALETTTRLAVRIANENDEPLYITGGVFNLSLGGIRVGKALSNEAVEVPPLESVVQEVDLFLNNIALATRLAPIMNRGEVDWRLQSKVYLDGPLMGRRSLKVTNQGSYVLPESWQDSLSQLDSAATQPEV